MSDWRTLERALPSNHNGPAHLITAANDSAPHDSFYHCISQCVPGQNVRALRQLVHDYLRQHMHLIRDNFASYLLDANATRPAHSIITTPDEYLAAVATDLCAGTPEIQAICNTLDLQLEIWSLDQHGAAVGQLHGTTTSSTTTAVAIAYHEQQYRVISWDVEEYRFEIFKRFVHEVPRVYWTDDGVREFIVKHALDERYLDDVAAAVRVRLCSEVELGSSSLDQAHTPLSAHVYRQTTCCTEQQALAFQADEQAGRARRELPGADFAIQVASLNASGRTTGLGPGTAVVKKQMIAAHLHTFVPSLMVMQEWGWTAFSTMLEDFGGVSFDGSFSCLEGGSSSKYFAMLWNSSAVEIRGLPSSSFAWPTVSERAQTGVWRQLRDRCCVRLAYVERQPRFMVVAVHAPYKVKAAGDFCVTHLRLLVEHLQAWCALPVLLAGDFNADLREREVPHGWIVVVPHCDEADEPPTGLKDFFVLVNSATHRWMASNAQAFWATQDYAVQDEHDRTIMQKVSEQQQLALDHPLVSCFVGLYRYQFGECTIPPDARWSARDTLNRVGSTRCDICTSARHSVIDQLVDAFAGLSVETQAATATATATTTATTNAVTTKYIASNTSKVFHPKYGCYKAMLPLSSDVGNRRPCGKCAGRYVR